MTMMDLICITLVVALFGATLGLVRFFEKLMEGPQ
jgi:hypothetical protein